MKSKFINQVKVKFENLGYVVRSGYYSECYDFFSFEIYLDSEHFDKAMFGLEFNGEGNFSSLQLHNKGHVDSDNVERYLEDTSKQYKDLVKLIEVNFSLKG